MRVACRVRKCLEFEWAWCKKHILLYCYTENGRKKASCIMQPFSGEKRGGLGAAQEECEESKLRRTTKRKKTLGQLWNGQYCGKTKKKEARFTPRSNKLMPGLSARWKVREVEVAQRWTEGRAAMAKIIDPSHGVRADPIYHCCVFAIARSVTRVHFAYKYR